MKEQVKRSNKAHMRLRNNAKTAQEARYHLACVMSQTNMDKLLTKQINYNDKGQSLNPLIMF